MVVVETLVMAALCSTVFGTTGTDDWSVHYPPSTSVCALKGATVELNATCTYPSSHVLTDTLWHLTWPKHGEPTNISRLPEYSNRVECVWYTPKVQTKWSHVRGSNVKVCGAQSTLRIRDVKKSDSREYLFRIHTRSSHNKGEKYSGSPGVTLSVTDLVVTVSSTMATERQSVTLTCSTTCRLTQSVTFTWYKNRRELPQPYYHTYKYSRYGMNDEYLTLNSVSREHSGNYSCAVKGRQDLISHPIHIDVRYGPKNTSVSLYPPGVVVVEGESVRLVCRADANPAVHAYTWLKQQHNTDSVIITTGESYYNITDVRAEHSGGYRCRARNAVSEATSAPVQIDVQYPPRGFKATIISPSGDIVEGQTQSVLLTCDGDANPPPHTYTWYKGSGAHRSNVGAGQNHSLLNVTSRHSGEYHCNAENLQGSTNSTPVYVDVFYPPKNVNVSVSYVEKTGSVRLSCMSDANPAEQSYTWHAENTAAGEEASIRGIGKHITLDHAESGFYYCQARNKAGATESGIKYIPEQQRLATRYAIFFTVAVGALIICILLILLRKKMFRLTSAEDTPAPPDTVAQGDSGPVYANVSKSSSAPVTSDPEERRANAEDDDVHYSSVYFKHCDKQEVTAKGALVEGKTKPSAASPPPNEEVLYSAVNLRHHHSMDLQCLQMLTSILILISGVLSDGLQVTLDPQVTYSSQSICGLKGSSLAVTCSFSPPTNQTISSVFWFTSKQRHHWRSEDQPEDLLLDADYMGRVTYSGTEGSSELTITDLRLGDSGVYRCLYVSNEGIYSDSTGVNITVTDLQIKAMGQDSVVMSCNTLCTLEFKTLKVSDGITFLYFNIFKNGKFRNHWFPNRPTIQLSNDDGGSYTCAVGGLDHLPSPAVCVGV
ncbi:B-cell receptor CD22-like [Engraulis encrasicolus]|uniref:B-cell receptor CD22-like n=1 Tax=Engraulis encrasicolus TaxID=184585 RepID=UPI002FD41487